MKVQGKWQELHEALAHKYMSTQIINEYDCMRSQNEILQSIKQLLERKKGHSFQLSHSHEFGTIQASSISQASYPYDDSLIKSKFTEEFEQSIINSALKDVKANCCQETYQTVIQYIETNKQKQFDVTEKKLEKIREEKDEASSQIVILTREKTNIEKELQIYKKKVEQIDDQKRKLKTRMDYVMDKQNRLNKLETSFAFKEKISLELKKRYERIRQMGLVTSKKVEQMYVQLDKLWGLISQKCEELCSQSGWKKQVLAKCKQQLVQERQILKQESEHIQKQYEVMNTVSMQFKKIFQQTDSTKSHISYKN